jgi:hypothetical protein
VCKSFHVEGVEIVREELFPPMFPMLSKVELLATNVV